MLTPLDVDIVIKGMFACDNNNKLTTAKERSFNWILRLFFCKNNTQKMNQKSRKRNIHHRGVI